MGYTERMTDFLKMDVFFVVSTVVVVAVGLLVSMVLYRIYRILTHVDDISKHVAEESAFIREDIAQLRADIKDGKSKFMSTLSFLSKFGDTGKRTRTKKQDNE